MVTVGSLERYLGLAGGDEAGVGRLIFIAALTSAEGRTRGSERVRPLQHGMALIVLAASVHGGTATARDDGGLSITVTIPSSGSPADDTGTQNRTT
jgi:hypothetical protein